MSKQPITKKNYKRTHSFFGKLTSLISHEPDSPKELHHILHNACERQLINPECLAMLEGVFTVFERAVRDVMIPRTQIQFIDITRPIDQWIEDVINSGHSRYPAIEGDPEKIVGILHTKRLLQYRDNTFNVRNILQPAVFIPETKRLNVLLRDFRNTHNHIAIVVDEFGSISGVITIEDVLEQIVGEIEDEFDDTSNDITPPVQLSGNPLRYRFSAFTKLEDFNQLMQVKLDDSRVDTIGGYLSSYLGHIPLIGETFDVDNLHVEIVQADALTIHQLIVEKTLPKL